MRKNFIRRIIAVALIFIAVFSFTACKPSHKDAPTSKVILFIGDGMGANHVYNTELYAERDMYFSNFKTQTLVDTNSLNGLTDSAAAATAMATGQRIENGYIAQNSEGEDITTITELAKENKYGVGVVTSDKITGATPAGFSAHADDRDNSAAILLSQRYSKIDLLLGSGNYDVYSSKFTDEGWTWAEDYSELSLRKKRFVLTCDDVVPQNGTDEEPTLTQLAVYAVKYMEKHHSNGYFLMIEGAKIDKASHSNDIDAMIANLLDFENAIKEVEAMLKQAGDDYSIIVTADHETGGLKRAESKEQLTNDLYLLTSHTKAAVPLYFSSTLERVPQIIAKDSILNTDIFLLCKYLLNID